MMSIERETQALTLVPLSMGVRENSARSIVHLPWQQACPGPPDCDLAHLIFHTLAGLCEVRLDTGCGPCVSIQIAASDGGRV